MDCDSSRRGDVLDGLGLGQTPRLRQDAIEITVVVRRVVMGEHEPLGAGLRRHVHGEGGGRVAPVGFRRELLLGVLAVVEQQVDVLAQLEDGVGDACGGRRGLMVGQVGDRPAVGLDPVAQRDAAVRDRTGHDLGRANGEVLVPGVDHDHLAPELIHVDREHRRLHRGVQRVLQAPCA